MYVDHQIFGHGNIQDLSKQANGNGSLQFLLETLYTKSVPNAKLAKVLMLECGSGISLIMTETKQTIYFQCPFLIVVTSQNSGSSNLYVTPKKAHTKITKSR